MKQSKILKGLRVLLAILFFVPIFLYFVDFANLLPESLHNLLHIQLVPAILAGIIWILIAQFLLVLVFGRIYCSVICPAGVLQDIINRIYCIGNNYFLHFPTFLLYKRLIDRSLKSIAFNGINT